MYSSNASYDPIYADFAVVKASLVFMKNRCSVLQYVFKEKFTLNNSDVFRGYRKGALGNKWVNNFNKTDRGKN